METAEKKARLVEAAVAVLSGADGGQLNITNLNKAVFYLDLFSIRDFGKPISCSAFIAIDQGPVVAHYEKKMIKPLQEAGLATQSNDGMAKPVTLVQVPPQWHYLDPKQLEIAKKIGKEFSKHTATKLSLVSHDNVGWQIAYYEGLGGGKQPLSVDLNIALQQIADDDEWFGTDLTDDEKLSFQSAKNSEGKPW